MSDRVSTVLTDVCGAFRRGGFQQLLVGRCLSPQAVEHKPAAVRVHTHTQGVCVCVWTHVALRLGQFLSEDGLDGLGHLGVQTAAGLPLTLVLIRFLRHKTSLFTAQMIKKTPNERTDF